MIEKLHKEADEARMDVDIEWDMFDRTTHFDDSAILKIIALELKAIRTRLHFASTPERR